MRLALRLTAGAMVSARRSGNVELIVNQFAESLKTNATKPSASVALPLHYLAEGRAKSLETARRVLDNDREAADGLQTDSPLSYLASSLAQLLEAARYELEHDREAAKASLATASTILQYEIERHSGANRFGAGKLTGWQIARVRAFIGKNLHRTIRTLDLSAVAQRSPAHFSRSFKLTFGEPPHAYVVKRRLEKACHLMVTSSAPLSEIALSAGFSDQAHLSKLFRQAFDQSPASWRRCSKDGLTPVQGTLSVMRSKES
jgi:AraC family transcriptional regulator